MKFVQSKVLGSQFLLLSCLTTVYKTLESFRRLVASPLTFRVQGVSHAGGGRVESLLRLSLAVLFRVALLGFQFVTLSQNTLFDFAIILPSIPQQFSNTVPTASQFASTH